MLENENVHVASMLLQSDVHVAGS